MELFAGKSVDRMRRKAKGLGRRGCPFAYWLASSDDAATERSRLEALFAKVPPAHQNSVRSRLLSKNENQHLACLIELEAWQFFARRAGWQVDYQPTAPFGTPDLLAVSPDGERYYVEVLTAFESFERASRRSRNDHFLDQIDRLEHYYLVNVNSISVEPGAKASHFKTFVRSQLDALHARGVRPDEGPFDFEYRADGVFAQLSAFPTERSEPGPVLAGVGHGLRMLPPTPFKERMRQKIGKYSGVADQGDNLLLAVGVIERIYSGIGVVNTMYGNVQVSFEIDRATGKQVSPDRVGRDFDDGILWDRRAGPAAPYLPGVLEVGVGWTVENENELRESAFGFVHNAFSDNRISPETFAELPQWALPGSKPDEFVGEWAYWKNGQPEVIPG